MGLDMYLYKEYYVGGRWAENRDDVVSFETRHPNGEQTKFSFKIGKLSDVRTLEMYWRKSNWIHSWFIENCADGVDDCREVYVYKDDLKKLLDTVHEVITDHDKAEELLPTKDGFFFGSVKYDEWYFEDLQQTYDGLKRILSESENEYVSFYYRASW